MSSPTWSISAGDLDALRNSHPHAVVAHASIYKPPSVFVGLIIGAPTRGSQDVPVAYVSGDIADVEEGMTVLIGTAAGKGDISRRRFRSNSGYILRFDENSVAWEDGQYVTVLKNWELWSVFPYIDKNDYTFFKDYDIEYSDQNYNIYPIALMGPHRVAFLDGASVSFHVYGTLSYAMAPGASITTYAWECDGGYIDDATAVDTYISFTNPGTYWVKLTVTDDNGKSQSTRRMFFIHQRTGAYTPYNDFSLDGPVAADWDSGGWSASVRIRGDASLDDFPDGALVTLWWEAFYDGEEKYLYYTDGNVNTFMTGYILRETVRKNFETGEVTFEIGSITNLMNNTKMFSVSLESKSTPSTWYQIRDLTVSRAVHHLWKWHSTLFEIADVYLPTEYDSIPVKAVDDFANGTLYAMVDEFTYQHSIFAHVTCDKHGIIRVERDANMGKVGERVGVTTLFTLTDIDRKGETDIEYNRDPTTRISIAMVSGTAYNGSSVRPLISVAPGRIPHPYGATDAVFERLVFADLAHANSVSGRVLAIANREIIEVRIPMAGNYHPVFDIAPQVWVYLDLDDSDTKREVPLAGNYLVRNISTNISTENGTVDMEIILEPEVPSTDGVEGEYPPELTGLEPFPTPTLPALPGWWYGQPSVVIVVDVNEGIYYTTTFNQTDPVWAPLNTGLEASNLDRISWLSWDSITNSKMWTSFLYDIVYDDNVFRVLLADPSKTWSEIQQDIYDMVISDPNNYNFLLMLGKRDEDAGIPTRNFYLSEDGGNTVPLKSEYLDFIGGPFNHILKVMFGEDKFAILYEEFTPDVFNYYYGLSSYDYDLNGLLFAIDGISGSPLDLVNKYEVTANAWYVETAGGTARYFGCAGTLAGKIYIFGGYDGGSYLDNVDIYDIEGDAWTVGLAGATARMGAAFVTIGNSMYIHGGYDGSYLSSLYRYDMGLNTWTALTGGATARRHHAAVAWDNMYIHGGEDAGGALDDFRYYSPSTDTWYTLTPAGSKPDARYGHKMVYYDGGFYLYGGYDGSNYKSDMWVYINNVWTQLASCPVARAYHGMVIYKDKIYVQGGYNGSVQSDIWEYSITTNTWRYLGLSGQSRYGHVFIGKSETNMTKIRNQEVPNSGTTVGTGVAAAKAGLSDKIVLATQSRYVMVSDDNGETLTQYAVPFSILFGSYLYRQALDIDPGGNIIMAIDSVHAIWKSSNGGQDWEPLSIPPSFSPLSVIHHPKGTENYWIAAGDEIYYTTDGGTSWISKTGTGLPGSPSIKQIIVLYGV